MNLRLRAAVLMLGLVPIALVLSCGGDLQVQFAEEQEVSFERFRDEVQPVLETKLQQAACTEGFCHATGVGGLTLVAEPDGTQIVENFQNTVLFVNAGSPEESAIIAEPLNAFERAHFPQSFPDENNCCYQIILNWIKDEANPGCECTP